MAFKNCSATDYNLDYLDIYISVGKKTVYNSYKDSEGKWHGTRTEYYLDVMLDIPYFDTIKYGKAGDMTDYGFYTFYITPTFEEVRPFIVYGTKMSKTFSSRGNENFRELVSFSHETENRDYAFRTKLHCDTPKSTATISYVDEQAYSLYINGSRFIDPYSHEGINMNNYRMYYCYIQSAQWREKSTTELSYNCGNKTIYNRPLEIKVGSGGWTIPESITINQYNNQEYFYAKTTNNTIHIKTTATIGATGMGYTGLRNDILCLNYRYEIDSYGLNNTDRLQFTCDEMVSLDPEETPTKKSWTGLTSPKFEFLTNEDTYLSLGGEPSNGTWTTDTHTDNKYYIDESFYKHRYKLSDAVSLPSRIGNITCTNPQLINPYTQGSTTDAQGRIPGQEGYDPSTTTQVVNNIFKIVPNLNCESRRLLSFAHPTLANSDAWELVNCHLDDNNEVIVDGENPYIYQDFYRPKYTSEIDDGDVLAETDYRQRHFTHYRYMNCNFIYRDITEPQVEGEYVWHPYRPEIELICKPYGDIQGHTWTAKFDDVSQNYDLLMCNANADSTQDEMSSVITPKFQKLYDTGITYFAESPITEFGYLPNIVGRVKIPVSTNSNHRIQLGTLTSYYSANIQWREKVADVMFVTDLNEDDFTPDYTEGREEIDIRIEEGKIYFNESVTNPTITITTSEETLTPLSEWGHNSNFNINSATINMSFKIGDETFTNKYTISFPTSKTIINFKDYTDGDKVGIEFKYYSIDNEDIAIYFYRGNTLMVKARYDIGMQIDCGSEFQEPLLYGQDNPGDPDDVTHNPFSLYHNRFILMCINGARSVEIPEVEKRSGGNYLTDTFSHISMGALHTNSSNKGNRHLFFRDDLGEIYFYLNTYNADADGNYHINALTQGDGGWVNWLKRTYTTATDGNGNKYYKPNLSIRPRADYLASENLARYINANGSRLQVVADYGASVGGVDLEDNPNGNITDTSPYANSGGITFNGKSYYSSKHGTQTTTNLNNKTRQLTKVIDGGKHHFSIVKILGYIWKNTQGLILRNNQGKIQQGGRRQ